MRLSKRFRSRAVSALCVAVIALAGVALAPPSAASAATSQFHGVNWADPHDNFTSGLVVPSGLNASDSYADTSVKAGKILDGFTAFGANTVRLPITPATVSSTWWDSYTGAIDTAVSKNYKVILSYWEGVRDGQIDDTSAWNTMWNTVLTKYGSNASVYFEPMNEPWGYNTADWSNIAAGWLQAHTNTPQSHVFISGVGYNRNASDLCNDSRFANVMFSIHEYAFFATNDYNGWVQDLKNAVGGCASRSVVDEYGAPTNTGINYDANSSGPSASDNNYIGFLQAMTNTIRSLGMGAVYWPGLWIGDAYSLTSLNTDGSLSIIDQSSIDRLQDAWGLGAFQIIGQQSNRCLEDPGFSGTPNTQVDIYDCNGGGNQRWKFTNGQIVDQDGLCLDARNNGTAPGTAVIIYGCTGGNNQQWTLNTDGSVVGAQSGLCLDVQGASTSNGTSLILYTCNGQSNQKWSKV